MKKIYLLLAFILAVQELPAQISDDVHGFAIKNSDVSYAPLSLFISGEGRVFPFEDGQMLQVGRKYYMIAIPDRGYVFTNWQPVNVFTFTEITRRPDGSLNPPIVSTVVAPIEEYIRRPVLEFTMQPVTVLVDTTAITVTESSGWQANFAPRRF